MKKFTALRHFLCCAAISMAATFFTAPFADVAMAQSADNWAADDNAIESRKIERYQQLVDQSPEKSYAFTQLMATVGKGAGYQKLLSTYEKKVASKPQNFNLAMVLGHMYQYGGRTADAINAYKKALGIKQTALVYMSIAAAEADNKNFEQAVQNYEAASKLNPNKEQKQEIWRAQAEIAIYRRDIQRAKICFAELIKLEPNSLFIRRELSQIYAQNRLYDEAREVLGESLKLSSVSASDKDQIELDIAALYEQEGNDDEALRRYEALSKKLAASHWMQRELTSHIIDINRRKGNIAGLAEALEKSWKSPNYTQHLELADLYDESNQPEKALAHIQKAISQSPKLPEAREKLIQYYRSHGQITQMIDARKALIKAIPDNPDYRFALYETCIQQNKLDEALQVLDETAKAFPNDFDVLRQVADNYQIHGRHQKALVIYENWIKKNPQDLEGLEALGSYYDNVGDKRKALSTWQKIEKLPLDKSTKLETLARIYDEHDYTDVAEELYAKSIQANPKDCQIRAQYADILVRSKKQSQAVEAWKELAVACPTAPSRTLAARQLASIYKARGNEAAGISQFKKMCDANPDNAGMVLLFAKLAEDLELPDASIPYVKSYLERHPNDSDAIHELSALQSSSGDYDSARQTLAALQNVNESEKFEALVALSDLDLSAGDLEAAQNHLSEALKLNASDADIHERLGDVLIKRRLYEDASNNYETAFQIDNRNYGVAFKNATCLSILGKDKEADDLYSRIVTDASDESLMLKAAQRAIDDHTFHNTLDVLAKSWLPLARSKKHKTLYLEILMQLAEAQSQPYVLAIRTRGSQNLYTARHALKELSESYTSVLVESLLSDDVALNSRALDLSEWLASAGVIQILGQKIESAPTSETGRQLQLNAIKAIAHAQLPASVPVLRNCLQSHYPRALREYAVWALGLIQSPQATAELVKVLEINFDSYRALAVIGLGRQGQHLESIRKLLTSDPSVVVKSAAAWALVHNLDTASKKDIEKLFDGADLKPYQLWTLARVQSDQSADLVLKELWCGKSENRAMAARIMRTPADQKKVELFAMTQPEAQGRFVQGKASTHYMSIFSVDLLLDHFAELETAQFEENTPAAWMMRHSDAFVSAAEQIANGKISNSQKNSCRIKMLDDMMSPRHVSGFDVHDEAQRPVLTQAARKIEPQIHAWIDDSDENLAMTSLRSTALIQSDQALQSAIALAKSDSVMTRRLQALDVIAAYQNDQSREALRTLAKDEHYLIRASAVQYLDPGVAQDRQILVDASKDAFLVVAETARKRLAR